MITAAGIVGPIALAGNLGFHPVYLALAIGCGSKPIMWMNDSGFWIIGKMSGLTEAETLKSATDHDGDHGRRRAGRRDGGGVAGADGVRQSRRISL